MMMIWLTLNSHSTVQLAKHQYAAWPPVVYFGSGVVFYVATSAMQWYHREEGWPYG